MKLRYGLILITTAVLCMGQKEPESAIKWSHVREQEVTKIKLSPGEKSLRLDAKKQMEDAEENFRHVEEGIRKDHGLDEPWSPDGDCMTGSEFIGDDTILLEKTCGLAGKAVVGVEGQ